MKLLRVREAIYDQFQKSSAGPSYFFLPENSDAYAAFYTSKYLIQDTGEALFTHMKSDFSRQPMQAYLEFWGVMQAIDIQQEAIYEIHKAVVGTTPKISKGSAWDEIRKLRYLCAGHPAKHSHGVPSPQRTFMGRMFGNYERIQYEMWDSNTNETTNPTFNLRQMIDDYDMEASTVLEEVLSMMKSKWP